MGADTLIGDDVYNLADESLGEKLFAVPWTALKLDTQNKRFVLDVDKERFEQAPGFDSDHWPDMADTTWSNEVHAYYGTTPG